jgi:hypothetical protein
MELWKTTELKKEGAEETPAPESEGSPLAQVPLFFQFRPP